MQKVDKRWADLSTHTHTYIHSLTQKQSTECEIIKHDNCTVVEQAWEADYIYKQSFIIITNLKKLKRHYNDQSRCEIDSTNHIISRWYVFFRVCMCDWVMKSKSTSMWQWWIGPIWKWGNKKSKKFQLKEKQNQRKKTCEKNVPEKQP